MFISAPNDRLDSRSISFFSTSHSISSLVANNHTGDSTATTNAVTANATAGKTESENNGRHHPSPPLAASSKGTAN
jgi:hypothetical protein